MILPFFLGLFTGFPAECLEAQNCTVRRSIATVGNYDYIMDVKFREDGELAGNAGCFFFFLFGSFRLFFF